ncbi:hypothetical protein MMC24_002993 [Lignoscripta atroalba]|nr:hypothetical protein [Lignoscripta atroalba]
MDEITTKTQKIQINETTTHTDDILMDALKLARERLMSNNSRKDESAAAFKQAHAMLQEYMKAESERYRKIKEVAAENYLVFREKEIELMEEIAELTEKLKKERKSG